MTIEKNKATCVQTTKLSHLKVHLVAVLKFEIISLDHPQRMDSVDYSNP